MSAFRPPNSVNRVDDGLVCSPVMPKSTPLLNVTRLPPKKAMCRKIQHREKVKEHIAINKIRRRTLSAELDRLFDVLPPASRPRRKVPRYRIPTSAIQYISKLKDRIERLEAGTEGLGDILQEEQRQNEVFTRQSLEKVIKDCSDERVESQVGQQATPLEQSVSRETQPTLSICSTSTTLSSQPSSATVVAVCRPTLSVAAPVICSTRSADLPVPIRPRPMLMRPSFQSYPMFYQPSFVPNLTPFPFFGNAQYSQSILNPFLTSPQLNQPGFANPQLGLLGLPQNLPQPQHPIATTVSSTVRR